MTPDLPTHAMLLTPPGAGAIGVVRLLGPRAEAIARAVFVPARVMMASMRPNRLCYGTFVAGDDVIDDVVCSAISLDGCVGVDICSHGGVRIVERILSELTAQGATLAANDSTAPPTWPVDCLIQHEAAVAMGTARTERVVRFLARQFSELPAAVTEIANIAVSDADAACERLQTLMDRTHAARRLVEGVTLALIGPANAGKSTLFNRLVGRPAAVVSATQGTTRDWIKEPIQINGVPVDLIDTAGGHANAGQLDMTAIARAEHQITKADIRLIVVDASAALTPACTETVRNWMSRGEYMLVQNKTDVALPGGQIADPREDFGQPNHAIGISALTGAGVNHLGDAILERLGISDAIDDVPSFFRPRHSEVAFETLTLLRTDPAAAGSLLQRELCGTFPADAR